MSRQPAADRVHAGAMVVVALGTIAYWVAYFAVGTVQTASDPVYVGFENSFPAADGYMAACWLAAAALLWRGRATAVPVGIAAGSAMVFLGLMDTLFNLEHGKYAAMTPEMAIETVINVACLSFGPFTMIRLWRIRARLDSHWASTLGRSRGADVVNLLRRGARPSAITRYLRRNWPELVPRFRGLEVQARAERVTRPRRAPSRTKLP